MVLAIIVTYQPNVEEFFSNISNLIDQVDCILIVDNGSEVSLQREIQLQIREFQSSNIQKKHNVDHIQLNQNFGLAHAQNLGIQYGLEKKFEYLLFLDDDSYLQPKSVPLMIEAFAQDGKIGMVSPNIIHTNSGKIQKYWVYTEKFCKRRSFEEDPSFLQFSDVMTVISSGCLIPMQVIQKCGLFREDYFIDYIDIEYCLRIQKFGFKITVIKNSKLEHKLGETNKVSLSGIEFFPTNHSPERRFYMIRNRIWTWKIYALTFPIWFLIDLGNFFVDNTRVFLFEKNRWKNCKFFWKGFWIGIIQKGSS